MTAQLFFCAAVSREAQTPPSIAKYARPGSRKIKYVSRSVDYLPNPHQRKQQYSLTVLAAQQSLLTNTRIALVSQGGLRQGAGFAGTPTLAPVLLAES
jgi:hypothetical protein